MNQKLYSTGGRHIRTGRYRKPKRRLRWRKEFVLFCSVLVLLVGVVGGTMAFLVDRTDPVENQFTYDKVSCSVNETMNGNTKSNISIQNTGSTAAYIRAEVIVTWQDADGNVYGKPPVEDIDYTMSELGGGWVLGSDGYYYCTSAVVSNTPTPELFASITRIGKNPANGYTLCVEILADAIQSSPAKAVQEAWGVTVAADGTISK